jgi:RES domain-containing protein
LSSGDAIDISSLKEAGDWINLAAALRGDGPVLNQAYWDDLVAGVLAARLAMAPGRKIYRARVMPLEQEDDAEPLPAGDMGPPSAADVKAGRFNRHGVPYFYGAMERETAIAEGRPWRPARISVARFTSTSTLSLTDLTGNFAGSTPAPPVRWLSFMLGRPAHKCDKDSYLASQHIADECRAAGLTGILYDSSLRPGGVNVVLFDDVGLVCQDRELFEVTGVSYEVHRLWP